MTRILARFPGVIEGVAPVTVTIEGATASISVDLTAFEADLTAYVDAEVNALSGTTTAALAGKQPLDATLTGLAAVTVGANRVIYATGADTFAATDFTAHGRALAGSVDAPATKTILSLGNVDNTSDATKNAAVATLTNKTLTSPVINSPTGIVKANVGLGNVDNTSDANKPVSTAQQTALDLKYDKTGGPISGSIGVGRTASGFRVDVAGSIRAGAQSGVDARIKAQSPDGLTTGSLFGHDTLGVLVGSETVHPVLFRSGDSTRFVLAADGSSLAPQTDQGPTLGTATKRHANTYSALMTLVDGVTAPSTIAGHAVIYVDSADGDLKIKFGDGTVKTIVVDT